MLKTATAVGLAAGAAALALPATGSGAAAGLQDDRLGDAVVSKKSTQEIETILNQIQVVKPKVVRVNFFWGQIAPNRPANPRRHTDPGYDWSRYDQIATGLRRRGIKPLFVVWDFPQWSSGRPKPKLRGITVPWNPNAPRKPVDFANFMFAAAERYDGTKANPNAPPTRLGKVNMYEVLNEPNLKSFFRKGSRSNVALAKRLHKAAYTQIKRANRQSIVIMSGFGPNSSGKNGNIKARTWMNSFLNDRTIRANAVGVHIYPANGPRAKNPKGIFPRWQDSRTVRRRGRIIRPMGGLQEMIRARSNARNPITRRAPIYVTEAGWTTQRTPFRAKAVTRSTQARYIKQMFGLPQAKNQPVALIIQFNYYDNPLWPGGLRTASGANKPSFAAFRAQSRKRLTGFQRGSIR